MAIKVIEGGGIAVTGEHVNLWQMLAQEGAIRLEIKGMHHSSGRSVAAHVKRQYGFKGNKAKVLEQLTALRLQKFPLPPKE